MFSLTGMVRIYINRIALSQLLTIEKVARSTRAWGTYVTHITKFFCSSVFFPVEHFSFFFSDLTNKQVVLAKIEPLKKNAARLRQNGRASLVTLRFIQGEEYLSYKINRSRPVQRKSSAVLGGKIFSWRGGGRVMWSRDLRGTTMPINTGYVPL
jgi:hypothetical protein